MGPDLRSGPYFLKKIHPMKIIDCHVHIGLEKFCCGKISNIPSNLCNSVEETIAVMDKYGIEKCIALPIPHILFDAKDSNEYIWQGYIRYPNRIIPFCRIDESLELNLEKGFQGVKLHLLYEDIDIKTVKKELQTIEDSGVPLLLHALFKHKVKQIEQILEIAPNIKIILAHMGRGNLYTGEQVVENAISLRKYSNIYMETSTVGDLKAIINACEIIGYDRVVFGSDYPFGKHVLKNYNYRIELNSFIEIFTPMQIEKICYENILHILDQSSKKYIQVRKAKKTDIENIFFIFDNLSEVDKKYLALSSKRTLIRQQIRNERHCYVAEIQGKIVGFLRESGRPGGYSLLEEIVVSPRYRNKGIATELLRFFHNIFHNNLAKTNSSNTTMIYLLKKHGYIAQNPDAPRIINWLRKANR